MFGAHKYYKKKLIQKSKADLKVKLSEFYKIVQDKDLKAQPGFFRRRREERKRQEAKR